MTPDLDQAIEQFWAALGEDPRSPHHSDILDDYAPAIVEALLAAGWRPPEVSLVEQVAERVRGVLPGVDVHVYSPEGEK